MAAMLTPPYECLNFTVAVIEKITYGSSSQAALVASEPPHLAVKLVTNNVMSHQRVS